MIVGVEKIRFWFGLFLIIFVPLRPQWQKSHKIRMRVWICESSRDSQAMVVSRLHCAVSPGITYIHRPSHTFLPKKFGESRRMCIFAARNY